MAWEIETVFSLDDDSLFAEMILIDLSLFMWDVVDPSDPEYAQYQDNLNSYNVPNGATQFEQVQFDGSVNPIPDWNLTKDRFFGWVEDTHNAEFESLKSKIGSVLVSLFGNTIEFAKINSNWANVEIRSGETKPTWQEVKDELSILDAAESVKATVAAAFKSMSENIAAQVYVVFGTIDEASANAFAHSWRIKSERAADYSASGYVALEAIAGFNPGDALDTEAKVQSYYDEKVNQLIVFDKFRDAEILAYLTAKAAAEA